MDIISVRCACVNLCSFFFRVLSGLFVIFSMTVAIDDIYFDVISIINRWFPLVSSVMNIGKVNSRSLVGSFNTIKAVAANYTCSNIVPNLDQ